jgi:hypothetical protein
MRTWRGLPPAKFRPDLDGSLVDSVTRDAARLVTENRQLPDIQRYAQFVDPKADPEAARTVVLSAFEHAPHHVALLAEAWRARYPSWIPAIDFAVGVVALSEDPDTIEIPDTRFGPTCGDGDGRYQLTDRIDRGSRGVVYRGIDRTLSTDGDPVVVAVKFLPCPEADTKLLLREAGAARRVAHAGVARILDAGILHEPMARRLGFHEACLFLIQEFVDGPPLWVWRACHPERTADECGRIVDQLREAVGACHAEGVVHGDLTPANVVIDADGRARLVDFGRANWGMDESRRPLDESADRDQLRAIQAWLVHDLPLHRRVRRSVRMGLLKILGVLAALVILVKCRW